MESNYVLSSSLFALSGPFAPTYQFALTDVDGVVQPLTGTLDPGRYRLTSLLEGNRAIETNPGNGFTSIVDLVFTPIPEPSTAALLTLGIAALARRRVPRC